MCRYEAFDPNETVFEEHLTGLKLYIVLGGVAAIMAINTKNWNDAEAFCRSI